MNYLFKLVLFFLVLFSLIIYDSLPIKTEFLKKINSLLEKDISKNEKSLAIVQVSTNTRDQINSKFIRNKINYTKLHNYGYFIENLKIDLKRSPSWYKLKATLNAFKSKYTWIWYLDMDTIITNHNIEVDLLTYYAEINGYHVILNKDCNGINAGSILFRKSKFSINFLNTLWNMYGKEINSTDNWNEQRAIIYLMEKNKNNKRFLSNILFVPQKSINSYPTENILCKHEGFWSTSDLIIHFAGLHNEELFIKYFDLSQKFKKDLNKFYSSLWIDLINKWCKKNLNLILF